MEDPIVSSDTPAERLEKDLGNVDAIISRAADILYELEKHLKQGDFDIDRFERHILRSFPLDDTRKLLFQRAVEKYRKAIDYTKREGGDLMWLLKDSKLNLDEYEGISAKTDPRRAGVMLIRLKSKADADQFDSDVNDDAEKLMKNLRERLGGLVAESPKREWIGKSIDLKSLGIEGSGLLGAIVVRDDAEKKEEVANHEYAHEVYRELLNPFIHKYLTGIDAKNPDDNDFTQWTTRFSEETRAKVLGSLGNVNTGGLNWALEVKTSPTKANPWEVSIAKLGVKVATPAENYEHKLREVLFEEHQLLNELRAYGFSHSFRFPKPGPTALRIDIPARPQQLGVMEPEMAARYFRLHLLLLKAEFMSEDLRLKALSICGVSQTMNQAIRLIEPLLKSGQWDLTKEHFQMLVDTLTELNNSENRTMYSIGDHKSQPGFKEVIPNQEAADFLSPPADIFEGYMRRFYPERRGGN